MSRCGWLDQVPEAARRDLYRQAVEGHPGLLAVSGDLPGEEAATLRALPGLRWLGLEPGRFRLLCQATPEAVAEAPALRTAAVQAVAARELCFPEGPRGDPSADAFSTAAAGLVAQRDGVGLYRASTEELRRHLAATSQASALRWLQTVLAVPRPDRALVVALLGALGRGAFQAPTEEPLPAGSPPAAPAPRPAPSAADAERLLGSQLAMLSVPCEPELVEGRLLAASTVLERVLEAMGLRSFREPAEEALAEALRVKSTEPLRRVLGEVLQLWRAEATPVALPAPAPVAAPEAPKQEEAARTAAKVLKVEPARIDALMDLVGQLVVAKNSLPFLARRAEEEFGSGKLGRSIRDQYGVINRITEELQGAVMRVRMVPMSDVFRRFPRLVRDLSGKLDKRIRLDLSGEETEADKDVVQDLFDPLMHLMRNSIDHGLEGPEERERAGKPPEGTIRLGATQQEDQVVIELGDDGRGIDPEALKRKAVARGFLAADAAARMTDEEALQLIFLAGFSTAEQVTELSGRGVGMDVVRSMVARVGGKISLKSAPGRGTTTTISLPLTMAVSHVMVIEVGGSTFGIPFASIVETVRVPRGELRAIEGGEALVLRDRLVPICRLRRALGLETAGSTGDTEALVLARAGGEVVGFVIDEFHEAVDVIVKPLAGVLQHLPRFSGTALLGDGRPLLILDLEEVVR